MRMLDALQRWGARRLGLERCRRIIRQVAHLAGIDLLGLAHQEMGILKYQNLDVTGEEHLIQNVLPRWISRPQPVLVDVGANVGEFARRLRAQFPAAAICAFEPVAATFAKLQENVRGLDVRCFDVGLGRQEATAPIYRSSREDLSSLASLYPEVARSMHRFADAVAETIRLRTLDAVAAEQRWDAIDFLKIDTEGNEFAVLQGAENLIRGGRIGATLFEFNEMNVAARVFLRDFYDLLPDYRFFRLDTRRLIPLGPYQPRNEIFQFQNLLAVRAAGSPAKERP